MSGHFDDLRKEYVIEDMFPRRELYNYLWNSDTVCVCNQFGGGSAWSLIGNTRRQLDSGQRLVYIKDRDSGRYFAATRNFSKEKFDLFNCYVGLGYQKIVSEYCGVRTEMTVVVPSRGRVLLHRISIQNISDKSENLDVYFYNRPCPALTDHDAYGEAVKAENFNGIIYAHDGYDIEMPYKYLYLAADKEFYSYEVSDSRFVGTYDAISSPIALQSEKLSGKGVNFESSYVGALQFRIDLNAGEKREICIVCGMARSESECSAYAKEFASLKRFYKELAYQEETNGRYTDVFKITSPDSILDSQTNIWLKRQLSLGKDWGRLYGKGFRDVMQDIAAFVSLDVSFARERILDVMKWQYEDGNPIRMFEPSYYYPYNDGGVWIPTTILTYLNESGDFEILDEKISWLKGTSAENSSYDKPIEYWRKKRYYITNHFLIRKATTFFVFIKRHYITYVKALDYLTIDTSKIKTIGDEKFPFVPVWEREKRDQRFDVRPIVANENRLIFSPVVMYELATMWEVGLQEFYPPYEINLNNFTSVLRQWKTECETQMETDIEHLCKSVGYITYKNLKLHTSKMLLGRV